MNVKSLHRPSRRLAGAIAAMALCWPLIAAADCTLRKPRAAEIDFNARALAALMAALPPAPSGVQLPDGKPHDFRKVPDIYEVLCDISKEGEFSVTAKRSYLRKHTEAEVKHWDTQYMALQTQIGVLRKLPADKVAQEQALRQQSNAAWQAGRDAEKGGDKATAQAREAEYRALRIQADAIQKAHEASAKPQLDALNRRRTAIDMTDQRVEVVLAMNLQRLPTASDRSVIGSQGAASPGKSAGLKVNNVVWSVIGTDGSLRQALAGAIDTARLQALVGKPLPSVADSEAFASRAVPVAVADLPAASSGAAPTAQAQAAAAPPQSPGAAPMPVPASPIAATEQPTAVPIHNIPDTARKAVDTVNQLRGLFGR